MEKNTNKAQDRMQQFFAGEKLKTLKRYQYLNKIAQKGKVLFTGSSLMEQFPVNEMLMTENIPLTAYNRGIGGYTTDDMLEHMEEMIFGTEPSTIFINIGTNDIGSSGYKLEHLIENYEKILQQIRERLGDPIYSRFDAVIHFTDLQPEAVQKLLDREIDRQYSKLDEEERTIIDSRKIVSLLKTNSYRLSNARQIKKFVREAFSATITDEVL